MHQLQRLRFSINYYVIIVVDFIYNYHERYLIVRRVVLDASAVAMWVVALPNEFPDKLYTQNTVKGTNKMTHDILKMFDAGVCGQHLAYGLCKSQCVSCLDRRMATQSASK